MSQHHFRHVGKHASKSRLRLDAMKVAERYCQTNSLARMAFVLAISQAFTFQLFSFNEAAAQTDELIFPNSKIITIDGADYTGIDFSVAERTVGTSIKYSRNSPLIEKKIVFISTIGITLDYTTLFEDPRTFMNINLVARTPKGMSEPFREAIFIMDENEQPLRPSREELSKIQEKFGSLSNDEKIALYSPLELENRNAWVATEVLKMRGGTIIHEIEQNECVPLKSTFDCFFIVAGSIVQGPSNKKNYGVRVEKLIFFRKARRVEGDPPSLGDIAGTVTAAR